MNYTEELFSLKLHILDGKIINLVLTAAILSTVTQLQHKTFPQRGDQMFLVKSPRCKILTPYQNCP